MDIEKLFDTPDSTEQFDVQDIEENKLGSLCAYISVLFLIPLLTRPLSKFARFHTNQGIVLFIFSVVVGVAVAILSALLNMIPLVGGIIAFVLGIVFAVVVIYMMALGMINSATGKAKELPVIGKMRILK